MAIDEQGTIYMVSEPDLFYVFRREPAEGERSAAANQTELKVGLSAISGSVQQPSLIWTHRNQPGG
ncbi:hypothetical protein FQZ97_1119100 [compost metagenome]